MPKPQLSHSCTSSFCHSNNICESRLWHLHFIPQLSVLCVVFCAQTFLNLVGAVSSPCGLRRQYSHWKVVVCPYHFSTLRISNTPWCCGCMRHTLFTVYEQIRWIEEICWWETVKPHRFLRGPQENQWAVHFQHFLQYFQISFMTLWKSRSRRLCKWNLPAVGNTPCRRRRTRRIWKHHFEVGVSRIKHQKWKETLDVRYSLKISNSESQSMNTHGRREKPSITLWENLQTMSKLWWCKNFKVFRIDMKDGKKMKEGRHKWARDALRTWSKNPDVARTPSSVSGRGKQNEFANSQLLSELQSHIASYRRTLIEKFIRSKLHKTWNSGRHNRESSCRLGSSW